MAATEFDAVVTVDKSMPYQQNLTTLPIAVVILDAVSNKSSYLLPLMPELERVLAVKNLCRHCDALSISR